MDDTLQFYLSLGICFAIIIGIVRFRKIDPSYYPFLYGLIASLVTEILCRILIINWQPDILNIIVNTYSLVDFCLFTWLFHNWGLFNRSRTVFISILVGFFVAWLCINIIISHFTQTGFYFFTLYSFALIFFGVTTVNKVIVNERKSLFQNAKFWICLGVIIFYSFFNIWSVTSLSLFEMNFSEMFWRKLQEIKVYSNLLVNLLYAVAVIWIPRKKNFTTRF
jgi:hypothetical protein